MLATQDTLQCDNSNEEILRVHVNTEKYNLVAIKPYLICISLLVKDESVIPGCSGLLNITEGQIDKEKTANTGELHIERLEDQVNIKSFHANVSISGSTVMVWLGLRLPYNLAKSHDCSLQLTVGAPVMSSNPSVNAKPQKDLAARTIDCSREKTIVSEFNSLPPHTYFNVCAVIYIEETQQKDASPHRTIIKQCLFHLLPM